MSRAVNPDDLIQREANIIVGDALQTLRRLPDNSVACCVTSPPYWGVRDYQLEGQIGIESALPAYLRKLSAVFKEVRRVVRPNGTLWLNIGDTYTSGNRGWRAPDKKNHARSMSKNRPPNPPGLKDKELVGVPWRLALNLQQQGWFLRSDIIWHKPNGQPESVKDRPSKTHEYIFLLSNAKHYYYDRDAIMERTIDGDGEKNRRSVWAINSTNPGGSHSATFPAELARLCVQASSQADDLVLDPFFGYGTVGLVCQEEGRRFLGIELSEGFVEEAKVRLGLDQLDLFRSSRVGIRLLHPERPMSIGIKTLTPGLST